MLKKINLKRLSTFEDGTFGVLLDDKIPFAVTLEKQWKDNKRFISCIPNGNYLCKRVVSPKFGEVFQVMDVPNRGNILFHKGNLEADTEGCILIGEQFETLNGRTAILQSGKGFTEFMDRLKDINAFELKVYWTVCI